MVRDRERLGEPDVAKGGAADPDACSLFELFALQAVAAAELPASAVAPVPESGAPAPTTDGGPSPPVAVPATAFPGQAGAKPEWTRRSRLSQR